MAFNWLNRQMMKDGDASGRGQRRRSVLGMRGGTAELAGRALKLASEDSDVPRSVERHGYPITRNPADLQNDVVPDVNPFADFSTEHQHD